MPKNTNIATRGTSTATWNELLIYERKHIRWSQEDVAKELAVDFRTVGKWEHGEMIPHPKHLKVLCSIFKRSPEQLGYPETQPSFWSIPYKRNPFFTGREDILKDLQALPALRDKREPGNDPIFLLPQALCALGGVGKTQTALEYAHKHRTLYHTIVWLRADSPTALASDFAAIARLIDHPVIRDVSDEKTPIDEKTLIEAVLKWLQDPTITKWLLIFDNVADLATIAKYIPQGCHGHVIITTRLHDTGSVAKEVEIEKMQEEEGAHLLLRRAKITDPYTLLDAIPTNIRDKAKDISTMLDGLPLAINQAGAYIAETKSTLQSYIRLYQTRHEIALRFQERFPEYPFSVATTWRLNFEEIRQTDPIANELLCFFSFLNPDAIPEELVTENAQNLGTTLEAINKDPSGNTLNLALRELLRYSLISRNNEIGTCSLHRLVQTVVRDSLNSDTQFLWINRTIQAVNHVFPEVHVETWPTCKRYLPHALNCAEYIDQHNITTPEAGQLLDRAGYYLRMLGQYVEAEQLLTASLAIRKKLFGLHHPETADSQHSLATNYEDQGKYQEAEQLYKQALRTYRKTLGAEDFKTGDVMNDLGLLYNYWGKYPQAERLLTRTLRLRKKSLGSYHKEVARSLNNLGVLYNNMGKYLQAKLLLTQAIGLWEHNVGAEHPDVAQSLKNLAFSYQYTGDFEQADQLYKRILEMREKLLGRTHPDYASTVSDMAVSLLRQGRFKEAEVPLLQVLQIYEKVLPHESPPIARTLHNLAGLYREAGEYKKAEELIDEALEMRKKLFGPNHTEVASSFNSKAKLLQYQGRYDQARELYKKALAIWDAILQPDDRQIVSARRLLITLLREQGEHEEAEAEEKRLPSSNPLLTQRSS